MFVGTFTRRHKGRGGLSQAPSNHQAFGFSSSGDLSSASCKRPTNVAKKQPPPPKKLSMPVCGGTQMPSKEGRSYKFWDTYTSYSATVGRRIRTVLDEMMGYWIGSVNHYGCHIPFHHLLLRNLQSYHHTAQGLWRLRYFRTKWTRCCKKLIRGSLHKAASCRDSIRWWRPVTDLSPVNSYVFLPKFKMETVTLVFTSIKKGDLMFSIKPEGWYG